MKKNKAFTLIELLAVIIVIGLLALLLIPKVNSTIKDSKKNAGELSTQALARESDNYFLTKKAQNSNFGGCNYNFDTNSNTCTGFEFKGESPEKGRIHIKSDGTVAIAVKFNDYCYLKPYNSDTITIREYNVSTCGDNAEVFTNYELPEIVTTGDGLYESQTEPGRYIYRGETPKNYIYINEGTDSQPDNVLYRIISFEPDGTIKVVRNASIGNVAWDPQDARPTATHSYCANASSYGCNAWSNQSNTYLGNNTFETLESNFYYQYFVTPTASSLEQVSAGGTVSADTYLNTYLNPTSTTQTNKWDKAFNVDKYLVEHSFNVGGVYYTSSYSGSKGLEKEKQEEKSLTWNGKIGLLNITEFVEASTNNECTLWNNYYENPTYYYKDEGASSATHHAPTGNNYPCKKWNWTFNGANQWSLSPNSNSRSGVWYVYSAGCFSRNHAYSTYGVRPAFYLKSSIRLSTSEGTQSDPYRILNI